MFNGIKDFFTKVGVKLGLIKQLQDVKEHRKVDISSDYYNALAVNKALYKGYYEKWHKLSYLNSNKDTITRDMLTLGIGKIAAQKMMQLPV